MAFCFENSQKLLIEEDKEDFDNINIGPVCEKELLCDEVREHCHLTGKNRGPAHKKCNINVTQDQSNFTPFFFHNFSSYDCHLFFKLLVDRKKR